MTIFQISSEQEISACQMIQSAPRNYMPKITPTFQGSQLFRETLNECASLLVIAVPRISMT